MGNTIKLAIISDIHANKYALEGFLKYNEETFQADRILNLGDFVSIGPHPKEVAELILSDERFENILGNNEMFLLNKRKEDWPKGIGPHRDWFANQLGPELIDKIENIPLSRTLTVNNKKILMLHSHFYDIPGRTIQDNLLIYQGKTLEEFLADYPEEVDIVLVGHSHVQLYISWEGKTIVNPGSISITRKPLTAFCEMEISDEGVNINFKNIPYDYSNLKEDFLEKNVVGKEFFMKFFYSFL
ncbi:hypothetical protein LCGC14_0853580 [marine sediment metagenome]|uniref:Calcineurin-like phosphoesterase domain-containing protein n=1 Tax=marine sediment metagenome TaxID=412755 RepID=A0A0F9RU36_9ZZZZ|nr:MAG: phosphodiesterase [Candidatus Lokiarchaeum sp. GC14_75]